MLDWSDSSASAARRVPAPLILTPDNAPDQTGLGVIDRRGGRVSVDEKRMINCRARTRQHRFIVYQDENGWLDVRANVHAIIGSDDTAVVNGA